MRRCVVCVALLALGMLWSAPAAAGLFGDDADQKPQVSDSAIAEIERALDDQRYLDAGRMLDQVALASEDDPRIGVLTGELALARSRPQDALARFKMLDTVAAVRPRALQGEGIALAALGKTDEAIPVLQKAVAEDAGLWRAWNALGVECDQRHDWAGAEAAFEHALKASGDSPIVLNNRGFSRLSQNRPDEAIADFVQALQKKPDFASARNNLRLAIAMKGDYQRAVSGASAADRAAVLNNAGYVAMLRGDYAAAKELFGQSMKAKGEYYGVAADNLEMAKTLEAGKPGPARKADAGSH
ncbi:MAG TPA: tetratricopeptide repeat protein [Rhizomicrobium sp.]|nr:tetratricopeptide repeat protein [Rhizomicrobium sp.]